MAVVGIYALHRQQVSFWKEVFGVLNCKGVRDVLILGDFNDTFDNDIDWSNDSFPRATSELP